MANATAAVAIATVPFTEEKIHHPLASTAQTYYAGAMVGRNTSGYATKFDDAASLRFLGVVADSVPLEVESGGSNGDKFITTERPRYILCSLTSAAITDEGKLCYAAYDNEVQLATGTYGNIVGRIVKYHGTGKVWVDTWDQGKSGDASRTMAATGAQSLTVHDLGKTIFLPNTAAFTLTLPAVADCEVGTGFRFVKTTSDAAAVTLDGNASETIDGATTYAAMDAQYDCATIVSDGTAWIITSRDIA